MTFTEIVAEVMERLNLTSTTATTRVGKEVNDRYRRLTSSIGLEISRRTPVQQAVTIGNRTVTFTNVEKIIAVVDKTTGKDVLLNQVTPDEMHKLPLRAEPPKNFTVSGMGPHSVSIDLDCVPVTGFTLYADAHVYIVNLSGSQIPNFSESFHDILVFGVMADEYRKMEKTQLMADAESNYERRLSDLRMWIAKTAYQDIYQGKNTTIVPWWKNTNGV